MPAKEQEICFQQKLMQNISKKFKYPTIAREMGIQEKIYDYQGPRRKANQLS